METSAAGGGGVVGDALSRQAPSWEAPAPGVPFPDLQAARDWLAGDGGGGGAGAGAAACACASVRVRVRVCVAGVPLPFAVP